MENSIEANEGTLFSPLFLRLLIPFGFAFFASTFIGSITSMIAPQITADFGLSPAQLGGFISVNLAAFGLAQFPLGVMLDRYGGRNTLVAMLLLACAGTLLFAAAKSYAALLAARALIGAGFAGALLSSFKSFTHWLPKRRLPLAFSIQSFVGGVGFMAATHPVTLALEYFTWRQIMFASGGAVALSIAMLLFCAPREDCGADERGETLLSSACGMLRFAWDKRLWYVAPVVTATEAVLYSFAYLWIGPWMRDAAALDERSAGLMMLLSSAGIAAGYLLNGVTADFCSRWKWMTWERLYACTGVLFSALMGGLALFGGRAAPLWCPVMFLSTMSMISFPIIGRLFAVEETGRVFSLLNFIIFAASFLMQWLVGVILNFYPVADGHFSPDGYRAALLAVFAVNAAAALHLCVYLPKIEKLRKF